MKNYTVLKPFFKQSEQKNYNIGDFIELSREDAEPMLKYDLVEEYKELKKVKKND